MRIIFTFIAALLSIVNIAGCATVSSDGSAEEQRLVQRAEARWGALMKGDLDAAYSFTSPDYRGVVSLQQYKGKFGRSVEWLSARVGGVRYDDSNVATVSVGITFRAFLSGARGMFVENDKTLSEKWLFKYGEWWYTDQ